MVGRFQEEVGVRVEELKDVKSVQDAMRSSGRESCGAVGEVVSFEVDPVTKRAILPSELLQKIEEKSQEKLGPSGKIQKRDEDGAKVVSPAQPSSQLRN